MKMHSLLRVRRARGVSPPTTSCIFQPDIVSASIYIAPRRRMENADKEQKVAIGESIFTVTLIYDVSLCVDRAVL